MVILHSLTTGSHASLIALKLIIRQLQKMVALFLGSNPALRRSDNAGLFVLAENWLVFAFTNMIQNRSMGFNFHL